jgi:hypothetical protein
VGHSLLATTRRACCHPVVKIVKPPQPGEAERIELAIKTAAARQTRQRRKWITITGSLLNLAALPAVAMLEILLQGVTWLENAHLPLFMAIPFIIGSLVAFAGMTMTDHRRDVMEWGCHMPLTCVAYGSIPYVVFCLFKPDLFLMMCGFIAGSAILNLAGGMITAAATKRWFLEDG